MTESATLKNPLEEDAYQLTEAAVTLSRALATGDKVKIADALDANLQLWVGIRTILSKNDHPMPSEVKENLIRLSHYTAQKTFEIGQSYEDAAIESLINTNLQIAEGLLEGKTD